MKSATNEMKINKVEFFEYIFADEQLGRIRTRKLRAGLRQLEALKRKGDRPGVGVIEMQSLARWDLPRGTNAHD